MIRILSQAWLAKLGWGTGYPALDNPGFVARVMICPGFCPALNNRNPTAWPIAHGYACYRVVGRQDNTGTNPVPFSTFGYPTAVSGYTVNPVQPHKMTSIQSYVHQSDIWSVSDLDGGGTNNSPEVTRKPVHVSVRLQVCFDGHIARAKVKSRPASQCCGVAPDVLV
jgi:hypothetical protein